MNACKQDKNKALYLYRCNVLISVKMFAILGAFEVALRNSVDQVMASNFGCEWLTDSIKEGGVFDKDGCKKQSDEIEKTYNRLVKKGIYTPSKLITELTFGFWRFMFAAPQFEATNQALNQVFPNKTKSTPDTQIDNSTIFNELSSLNSIRNRIAHHEPICFDADMVGVSAKYVLTNYNRAIILFSWMGIDPKSYLRGLNHVREECEKIDRLAASI